MQKNPSLACKTEGVGKQNAVVEFLLDARCDGCGYSFFKVFTWFLERLLHVNVLPSPHHIGWLMSSSFTCVRMIPKESTVASQPSLSPWPSSSSSPGGVSTALKCMYGESVSWLKVSYQNLHDSCQCSLERLPPRRLESVSLLQSNQHELGFLANVFLLFVFAEFLGEWSAWQHNCCYRRFSSFWWRSAEGTCHALSCKSAAESGVLPGSWQVRHLRLLRYDSSFGSSESWYILIENAVFLTVCRNENKSKGSLRGSSSRSRVAFRTKSELEVLDDGYKWRKYGRKKMKNSPNPR